MLTCSDVQQSMLQESFMTTPENDLTIGLFLKELLLKVRHHGVFENVHSAFVSFCYTSNLSPI